MARAVERGLERRDAGPIVHIGIAEKSFGKGQDYVTVLTDIDGSRVVEVAPGRTESTAEFVLQSLTDQQRLGVQAIACRHAAGLRNCSRQARPQCRTRAQSIPRCKTPRRSRRQGPKSRE